MSQSIRSRISQQVRCLGEADLLPFHDLLDAEMVEAALAAEGVAFRERLYTPLVNTCLFLSQLLDPDHSCRAAVARLIARLAIHGRRARCPETGSYCDARQRLLLGVAVRLAHQTAHEVEASAAGAWHWKGRRVTLVDGTTASMPDTEENQGAFPQMKAQGRGLGFPIVRMVALIALCLKGRINQK